VNHIDSQQNLNMYGIARDSGRHYQALRKQNVQGVPLVYALRDIVSVLMTPWGPHSLTVPRMSALAWLSTSSIAADTR